MRRKPARVPPPFRSDASPPGYGPAGDFLILCNGFTLYAMTERIHPELNPEDIPPSTASEEEIREMKIQGDKVVPIGKTERQLRNQQNFFKKRRIADQERREQKDAPKFKEYVALTREYACGIDVKPRWCVWGKNFDEGKGVLFWIKPSPEDEFVARRLSKLITELGGHAQAEKTEWNETSNSEPIYRNNTALDL